MESVMSTPLSERLRWAANTARPPESAVDAAIMARTFGWFFGLGGLLALLSIVVPHPSSVHEPTVAACAVAAFAGTAIFIVAFDRLPMWWFHLMLALAIVLVGIAAYAGGPETAGAYATMWFWSAITAFSFFSRTAGIAYTCAIAVSYAALLGLQDGMSAPAVEWVMVMGAVLVAGLATGTLRRRLELLLERVAEAARTDPLTGLANRRAFDERFETEIERARRTGRPIGVIAVDLDHFKQVNDGLGHQAGDEALQRLAGALRRSTRQLDLLARLGGEEFVIVAPETAPDVSYALAERVRSEIARSFQGGPMPLTASCGVATVPWDGDGASGVLDAADRALYAAKEAGRNRSMVSPATAHALGGPAPAAPPPQPVPFAAWV
jgi:diguanylate cyclase (GGDEF)-like protein